MYSKKNDRIFVEEWKKYLIGLASKKKNLPAAPSPGWLSEMAAKNNLCTSTGKLGEDVVVCGAELWKYPGKKSAWICAGCEKG